MTLTPNLWADASKLLVCATIATLALMLGSCAPDSSFRGSADALPSKQMTPPATQVSPPSIEQPVTPDLSDSDQLTLKSCQQKLPTILQNVKAVEVQDLRGSISNTIEFVDQYQGSEKRVLIINLGSSIVNKLMLQLGNPNTTYCLNISSQIVNVIDIGISRGARLIEARQISIQNKVTTHPI
jgi:hypothetical protein